MALFFEVNPRTIDNYIAQNENELKNNGYEVLKGNSLKLFKIAVANQDVDEIYFVNIRTTPNREKVGKTDEIL